MSRQEGAREGYLHVLDFTGKGPYPETAVIANSFASVAIALLHTNGGSVVIHTPAFESKSDDPDVCITSFLPREEAEGFVWLVSDSFGVPPGDLAVITDENFLMNNLLLYVGISVTKVFEIAHNLPYRN